MKFILSLFLVSFTFMASANSDHVKETSTKNVIELITVDDRRKNRKNKRLKKRRKRKCQQFGRRVYAG